MCYVRMLLVGTNAETSPAEWLGWSRTETPQVEILFLLKSSLHLQRLNLLYWTDASSGIGTPANVSIIDENDVTHSFIQTDLCEEGEGVKWLSFIQGTTVLTSYVKLQLEYEAGVDVMLLTEVELIGMDGVNVVTERNASVTVCPTTPPTTPSPPPTTTVTTVSSTSTATTSTPTTSKVLTTQPTTTTTTTSTTQETTTVTTNTATTPIVAMSDTTDSATTPSDTNTTSSPTSPQEKQHQLIIGLIFLIIIIIIIVIIVILIVSVFYYMKSKGKGVADLSCVGARGKFQKLMSTDVESNRPGLLKRMSKGGRTVDPIYEPVQPKLQISDPVSVKEPESFTDTDSFTDPIEDLHIYAPVSVSYNSISVIQISYGEYL